MGTGTPGRVAAAGARDGPVHGDTLVWNRGDGSDRMMESGTARCPAG